MPEIPTILFRGQNLGHPQTLETEVRHMRNRSCLHSGAPIKTLNTEVPVGFPD